MTRLILATSLISLLALSAFATDRFPICAKEVKKGEFPASYRGWYMMTQPGEVPSTEAPEPERCLEIGANTVLSPAIQDMVNNLDEQTFDGPANTQSAEVASCFRMTGETSAPDLLMRLNSILGFQFEIQIVPNGAGLELRTRLLSRTPFFRSVATDETPLMILERDTAGACKSVMKDWVQPLTGLGSEKGMALFNRVISGRVHAMLREATPENREKIISHWKLAHKPCEFGFGWSPSEKPVCPTGTRVAATYVGHTAEAEPKRCEVTLYSTLEWPDLPMPSNISNYNSGIFIEPGKLKPRDGLLGSWVGTGWSDSVKNEKGMLQIATFRDGIKFLGGRTGARIYFDAQGNPSKAEEINGGAAYGRLKAVYGCEDLVPKDKVDSALFLESVDTKIIYDMTQEPPKPQK